MTGQVEKQVFKIGLTDFDAVQVSGAGGQIRKALVHVAGRDFDDSEIFDDAVFDSAQVFVQILNW